MTPTETEIRRRLILCAGAAVAGIALSVAVDATTGGWVTVIAVAGLIYTLHQFGRTGPT
jgi:hypothetical protein